MKLNQLLKNVDYKTNLDKNLEIEKLTCKSKDVTSKSMFACIKGVNFDGHDFAKQALNSGASAVLVEKSLNLPQEILVKNSHLAYAQICANYFNNPAEKLKLIGVTGTNGKTSTTKIIKTLLSKTNKKIGLIGTIQNEIDDEILKTEKTTPDHFEFQKLLHEMLKKKCEYVVIEVSSHAINQYRTGTAEFEIGIFLNLSQDHLDYHQTMENYFLTKKKLFNHCKKALICIDSKYGIELLNELKHKKHKLNLKSFSTKSSNADFYATNVKLTCKNVNYTFKSLNFEQQVEFSTPGLFAIQNSIAAIACCLMLKFNSNLIFDVIKTCPPIKGRSEAIEINQPFTVICDYAHTPDGLKNILTSIKSYCNGKIITLIGCGGDRDKKKRPIMGKIAANNSDFVIITSDNPRTENPAAIIEEIYLGLKDLKTPYIKIVDRKKAIEFALKNANKNDVILLAGKGHESYQIVGDKKLPFNEPEIVQNLTKKIFN